jgi:Domain of unknown function (DUF4282)
MQCKGFLSSLLDYSFHSMITSRIVKLVYVLTSVLIAIYYVVLVVIAFDVGTVPGAITLLVIGPIAALIELIWARILLEFVVAQFRIMENTGRLVQQGALAPSPTDDS